MKSVSILGAGESGLGAALLATDNEYEVFVSDAGEIAPKHREELIINKIPFEEKGHDFERLVQNDIIVKSPGIPDTAPIVLQLAEHGKSIISEVEFAYMHCSGKVMAITGSNGKTTTASLCHHILSTAGRSSVLCGNVGESFARVLTEGEYDWYVVEVSSFQLDGTKGFKPDIAILLNITEDHLDRYNYDFDAYAQSKMRIAKSMGSTDVFIYNSDDAQITGRMNMISTEVKTIGLGYESGKDLALPGELSGTHNRFNASCAVQAAQAAGLSMEEIQPGLDSFKKPEHRMEFVAEMEGVAYINDSKATNVDSVFYALDAIRNPIIWIAGGQDKGNDYSKLSLLVEGKVKVLICLGLKNERLVETFSSKVDAIMETTSASEAVNMAASYAQTGDVVLLSPACASFDLFKNYIDRGNQFKKAVNRLLEK